MKMKKILNISFKFLSKCLLGLVLSLILSLSFLAVANAQHHGGHAGHGGGGGMGGYHGGYHGGYSGGYHGGYYGNGGMRGVPSYGYGHSHYSMAPYNPYFRGGRNYYLYPAVPYCWRIDAFGNYYYGPCW